MNRREVRRKRGVLRAMVRWVFRLVLLLVVLLAVVLAVAFWRPLYHRFYLFPRQAEAWAALVAQRNAPVYDDGWPEFRGVMHSHSELSHDSRITFPEIARQLNQAGVDFIFMSDHCVEGKADYSLGWKGLHDGILFVRGYEMRAGFMPWGLPDDTVLDCKEEPVSLARRIVELGGVLFFAHSEEERLWDLPELTGMEIYNTHTDFKDESLRELLPDVIVSLNAYPDQAIRLLFDRQTDILQRWDDLNRTRKIVGIAANDCHQNTGLRGVYTEAGSLRFAGTGKDETLREFSLNPFTRLLLRLFYGPLTPGRELVRWELDPYERSARFVNTHILADECTEASLLEALRQGRVFVAFDMLADARGFVFLAERSGQPQAERDVVMGGSVPLEQGLTLKAASPLPCLFRLIHDGRTKTEKQGNAVQFVVTAPGKYRLEAELEILGEWTPWVYTNPIEVMPAGDGAAVEASPGAGRS